MAFAAAKLTFYIKLSFVEIAKKAEVGIAAGRDSARNIYHPLVNLMEKNFGCGGRKGGRNECCYAVAVDCIWQKD